MLYNSDLEDTKLYAPAKKVTSWNLEYSRKSHPIWTLSHVFNLNFSKRRRKLIIRNRYIGIVRCFKIGLVCLMGVLGTSLRYAYLSTVLPGRVHPGTTDEPLPHYPVLIQKFRDWSTSALSGCCKLKPNQWTEPNEKHQKTRKNTWNVVVRDAYASLENESTRPTSSSFLLQLTSGCMFG